MIGGYQIIDFKNTGDGKYVEGIYESLTNSNGKPILLENVSIQTEDGIIMDVYSCFSCLSHNNDDSYTLNCGSFEVTKTGDDSENKDFVVLTIVVKHDDSIKIHIHKITIQE